MVVVHQEFVRTLDQHGNADGFVQVAMLEFTGNAPHPFGRNTLVFWAHANEACPDEEGGGDMLEPIFFLELSRQQAKDMQRYIREVQRAK